jgi:hypothetical protein
MNTQNPSAQLAPLALRPAKKSGNLSLKVGVAAIGLCAGSLAHQARAQTYSYTGFLQSFTVSTSGIYDITAFAASGGDGTGTTGGLGAEVVGEFNLSAGTTVSIVVGGQGGAGTDAGIAGGGGGGSFVYINGAAEPLVVAGGGGGAGSFSSDSTSNGGDGGTSVGGTGLGGAANDDGSGGGGFKGGGGTGTSGASPGSGPTTFAGGSAGGGLGGGGYGGGAEGATNGGGGGGGYTGGDGGFGDDDITDGGTGGASYVATSALSSSLTPGTNQGNGEVIITDLSGGAAPEASTIWAGLLACFVTLIPFSKQIRKANQITKRKLIIKPSAAT